VGPSSSPSLGVHRAPLPRRRVAPQGAALPPPPPHPPLVYPAAVDRPGRRVTNGRGARAGGRTRIGVGAGQVRCKDLKAARGVYGRAIGVAPKERVFKSYIELELQMGNIDRVSV
jgi:hypothetical protein